MVESVPNGGSSSNCTLLSGSLDRLLKYHKQVDSSPSAIIAALFAKAFRSYLKKHCDSDEIRGNPIDVRGKIIVSTRAALGVETVHNCYMQAMITYTDDFDAYDAPAVCSIFRSILDLEVQPECAFYDVKNKTESLCKMEENPDQVLVSSNFKRNALERRKNMCNFNLSYFGAVSFDDAVSEHIVDFQAVCFNENCDLGIFGYSFKDKIYLMVSDNYVNYPDLKKSELVKTSSVD